MLRFLRWRLALLLAMTCGTSLSQVPLLPALPCEGLLGEQNSTRRETAIDLENGTAGVMRIFQVQTDGKLLHYRDIAPQTGYRVPSYVGETYIVENEAGKCLAGFRAVPQVARAHVGGAGVIGRLGTPPSRLTVTVSDNFSVKPDQKGPYVDGDARVRAVVCEALNLDLDANPTPRSLRYPCAALDPSKLGKNTRELVFDLGKPVPESGAKSQGVIRDFQGNIHVFLSHDHDRHFVHNIFEVAPGQSVESERIQFGVGINGVRHVLLVGPWAPGEFATNAKIHADGTSKATVTRTSETRWIVKAPEGALARLWNNTDPGHPLDLGLYHLSFEFTFELLPESAN